MSRIAASFVFWSISLVLFLLLGDFALEQLFARATVNLAFEQQVSLALVTILCLVLVNWRVLQSLCVHLSSFLSRFTLEVDSFHLLEIELLRSENRTRSGDSDPAYERFSSDSIVLHGPKSDQSACSSQSSFAMDGYCPIVLLEM